jgi:hypothetical protein
VSNEFELNDKVAKGNTMHRLPSHNSRTGRRSVGIGDECTDSASGEREFTRSETRQEFRWSVESLGDFRYGGYVALAGQLLAGKARERLAAGWFGRERLRFRLPNRQFGAARDCAGTLFT